MLVAAPPRARRAAAAGAARVPSSPAYVDLTSLHFQPRAAAPRQRAPRAVSPRADEHLDSCCGASRSPAWSVGLSQGFTTVVVRNLPESLSRDMLTKLLDAAGYAGKYDFVYVPMDFASRTFRCFAFVNFVSPAHAAGFAQAFRGFSEWEVPWDREAEVAWSSLQGLEQQVERYRNSPVMHDSFPDEWKPLLLRGGAWQRFPPPTRRLRHVRLRQRRSVDLRTGPELGVLSGVCPVIAAKAAARQRHAAPAAAGRPADAACSDGDGASTSCAGSEAPPRAEALPCGGGSWPSSPGSLRPDSPRVLVTAMRFSC